MLTFTVKKCFAHSITRVNFAGETTLLDAILYIDYKRLQEWSHSTLQPLKEYKNGKYYATDKQVFMRKFLYDAPFKQDYTKFKEALDAPLKDLEGKSFSYPERAKNVSLSVDKLII